MRVKDPQFRIFLRMTAKNLEEILIMVGPLVSKQNTVMRDVILAKERLAVALEFLATGEITITVFAQFF